MKRTFLFLWIVIFNSLFIAQNFKEKRPIYRFDHPKVIVAPDLANSYLNYSFDPETDSLSIYFKLSTLNNITSDHLFSIIEVYDQNRKLLHCIKKTDSDTLETIQNLTITNVVSDTVNLNVWGFYYDYKYSLQTDTDTSRITFIFSREHNVILPHKK